MNVIEAYIPHCAKRIYASLIFPWSTTFPKSHIWWFTYLCTLPCMKLHLKTVMRICQIVSVFCLVIFFLRRFAYCCMFPRAITLQTILCIFSWNESLFNSFCIFSYISCIYSTSGMCTTAHVRHVRHTLQCIFRQIPQILHTNNQKKHIFHEQVPAINWNP